MEQNMDSHNHPTTDVCDTHLSLALALGLTSTFNNNNSNNDNSMSEQEGYNNHGEEVVRMEKASPARQSDEEEEEVSPRKKLRLTNHQSSLLEDTFKLHTTLTPCQKQALANQLNLRPRQVEVWFQNRRARTKLKHTEMECAMMKKRWEKLTEDNKRLHNELCQLKLISVVCPSCNKPVTKPPEPDHVHLYASSSVHNYKLVRELT